MIKIIRVGLEETDTILQVVNAAFPLHTVDTKLILNKLENQTFWIYLAEKDEKMLEEK